MQKLKSTIYRKYFSSNGFIQIHPRLEEKLSTYVFDKIYNSTSKRINNLQKTL